MPKLLSQEAISDTRLTLEIARTRVIDHIKAFPSEHQIYTWIKKPSTFFVYMHISACFANE